jgi:hypothetical protein
MSAAVPIAIVVGGFLSAGVLSKAGLKRLSSESRAAVLGAFAWERRANLVAIAVFVVLLVMNAAVACAIVVNYFLLATAWATYKLARLPNVAPARTALIGGHLCLVVSLICATAVAVAKGVGDE